MFIAHNSNFVSHGTTRKNKMDHEEVHGQETDLMFLNLPSKVWPIRENENAVNDKLKENNINSVVLLDKKVLKSGRRGISLLLHYSLNSGTDS